MRPKESFFSKSYKKALEKDAAQTTCFWQYKVRDMYDKIRGIINCYLFLSRFVNFKYLHKPKRNEQCERKNKRLITEKKVKQMPKYLSSENVRFSSENHCKHVQIECDSITTKRNKKSRLWTLTRYLSKSEKIKLVPDRFSWDREMQWFLKHLNTKINLQPVLTYVWPLDFCLLSN